MVFYGFMGFTQLPPQHSQFFQKLSSRRPDLRNPVLLGCHWYLTCASCVCIFMYFPRMTVWRFFFLSFFPDDGFPWTTSCYFTCATVEPGFCSPETSPGMRLHWLYLKVSYGTGSKVDDEAWDDSFQQARLGQLFWGLELFGCGFHQTSSPSWPVVISFRPTQHFKHAMASSGLIWQLILSQRARRAGPRGSRSPMCVYLQWRLA